MPATLPRPVNGPTPFAFPARLIVFLVFMTQFIALLLGLGWYVPYLHEQGSSTILLVLGSLAGMALFQLILGLLLRLVPVRCAECRDRAHFAGFGWWPFIYRFTCRRCGAMQRLEVRGR